MCLESLQFSKHLSTALLSSDILTQGIGVIEKRRQMI